MDSNTAQDALNIHNRDGDNRPTPTGSERPTYTRPSDTPTDPAPRPLREDQVAVVLRHYRHQQAKLASLQAQLRELGIDPNQAWEPSSGA